MLHEKKKKEARDGAACLWHAFSTDRSGAETAACQWHAFGADRSGAGRWAPVAAV